MMHWNHFVCTITVISNFDCENWINPECLHICRMSFDIYFLGIHHVTADHMQKTFVFSIFQSFPSHSYHFHTYFWFLSPFFDIQLALLSIDLSIVFHTFHKALPLSMYSPFAQLLIWNRPLKVTRIFPISKGI